MRNLQKCAWIVIVSALLLASPWVRAQDIVLQDDEVLLDDGEQKPEQAVKDDPGRYNKPFTGSLFLSQREIEDIRLALITKPKPPEEAPKIAEVVPPKIEARRMISLSGVLYKNSKDWVIWINGKKVQPDKLLPEIKGIEVEKDRVHLKWFDNGLNSIISISMRPHQKYDIVTGVLLPG